MKIYEARAKANLIIKNHLVVDTMAGYGEISDGHNRDSDYNGSGRTLEFSRSTADTTGEVIDAAAGLGYRLYFGESDDFFVDDLILTVLGGYGYNRQKLNDKNLFREIPVFGSTDGLNSTYETVWKGPWAGFELAGAKEKVSGSFRFEYHFADYNAEANWNLRSDFQHPKSFEHFSDGYGLVFNCGLGYQINDRWNINLSGDLQRWKTDSGLMRFYFANGTITDTRLNEVEWYSWAVLLGATYYFNL